MPLPAPAPDGPPAAAPPVRTARLLAMGLAAVQWARFADERYAIDDAWISFRTARNLVEHGILTFDVTQPPVEGVTNLLWTLITAAQLWAAPGIEPGVFARGLGGLCLFGACWLAVGIAARLADAARPGSGAIAAFATAVVLGCAGNVAYHALSGLESGFYLLLWLGAVHVALGPRRPALLAALLVALGMTRPEGVLLGAMTLGFAVAGWTGPGRLRDAGLAALGWGAGIAALEGFRLAYFGALVPNTFYAKPPSLGRGLVYVQGFALAVGVLGPLGAGLAAWRSREVRGLLGIATVLAAGVAWSGGDWMVGYRRLLDVYAVVAIGAGVAVALDRRAVVFVAAMVAGSGWLAGTGHDAGRYGLLTYGRVGGLLATTPGVNTVAAIDIGRLGWYYPGSILDLAGLTDSRWAKAASEEERHQYFVERAPDVVLVVSAEPLTPALSASPDMRWQDAEVLGWLAHDHSYTLRQVVPVPGGHNMAILVRLGLDLPEATWGTPIPE